MVQPICVLLVSLAIGGAFSPQSVNEHLYSFVRVGENYGTTYTSPPAKGAYFVIFQGEPITVRLDILNDGSKKAMVIANELRPEEAFQVTVLKAPTPEVRGNLGIEVSPSVKLILPKTAIPVEWSERIELPPQARLYFEAKVTGEQEALPPGIYHLKFRCRLKSASGKEIPAHSEIFQFEIRAVETFEDRLEVLIREATRLFVREKYEETEKKVNELLLLYPNSAAGYGLKGSIAEVRGKKDEAIKAYRKALDLLRSGRDTIYLSYASNVGVEHSISGLVVALRSLQGELEGESHHKGQREPR
ncbi:MAG: hypothetical protein D6723_16290 [Acidobacteria bacterium]|nr:MAG: hypothetical protein D6723_16290 [Acidobacteriota bacterium]